MWLLFYENQFFERELYSVYYWKKVPKYITDRQVVASGRKLNLRRDLRWVAKRTRKFPRKYMQVAKKTF